MCCFCPVNLASCHSFACGKEPSRPPSEIQLLMQKHRTCSNRTDYGKDLPSSQKVLHKSAGPETRCANSFLKTTFKRNEAPFQIRSLTGLTRVLNQHPLEQQTLPFKTAPHLSHASAEKARNKTNSTGCAQKQQSLKKPLFSLLYTS